MEVAGDRVRLDLVVWALFKNNWKELLAISSERKTVQSSCKKANCIWPEHFVLIKRKKENVSVAVNLPIMQMDSQDFNKLMSKMSKLFVNEKLHFCVIAVSCI